MACALLLGVGGIAGFGRTASGQQAAYASNANPHEVAQELAKRSIECLRRGEDAVSPENRQAAFEEGKRLAEQAIAADDSNADAHFARFANEGRLLLAEGATPNPFNMIRVNRDLNRVLELNPNHPDALTARGGIYRQLPALLGGSLTKAEECLTRAIDLEPDHAVGARVELAQIYRDRGQPERGIPLLQTAVSIAERDGKLRQRDEARALLREFGANP